MCLKGTLARSRDYKYERRRVHVVVDQLKGGTKRTEPKFHQDQKDAVGQEVSSQQPSRAQRVTETSPLLPEDT